MKFPPFQRLVNFLRLYALQNPTQSPNQSKLNYTAQQASFRSKLNHQTNFISQKTLNFSKLNDYINCGEIEWKVVSPFLWNLIQTKLEIEQLERGSDELSEGDEQLRENIPKIAVCFQRGFILGKGQTKIKNTNNNPSPQDNFQIYCNDQIYFIPTTEINQQILNQLKSMTKKQANLIIIIGQPQKQQILYRKLTVHGYFPSDVLAINIIKSLVEIDSFQQLQHGIKYYLYDSMTGERFIQKFKTHGDYAQNVQKRQIVLCITPLDQIFQTQEDVKSQIRKFLEKGFKFIKKDLKRRIRKNASKVKVNQPMGIKRLLKKISRQKYYDRLRNKVDEMSKHKIKFNFAYTQKKQQLKTQKITQKTKKPTQQLQISIQIRTGFKPYNQSSQQYLKSFNQAISSELLHQTRSNVKIIVPAQDDALLDSLTTNMDTPMQEQHQMQQESYENKRLHKHSTGSRIERKRKVQNYMQKKKKNNLIIKGTSIGQMKENNESLESKKRVKFPLFLSLDGLKQQNDTLQFLVQNMRNVALQSIYLSQEELIQHPYVKSLELNNENSFSQITQSSPIPTYFTKKNKAQQRAQSLYRQQKSTQLLKISQQIQEQYEPHNQYKFPLEQLQKMQFLSDYENQISCKKDNQQIKTIIDNSQGPYSDLNQQSIKMGFRNTEKEISNRNVRSYINDDISSMTDEVNHVQDDREETI